MDILEAYRTSLRAFAALVGTVADDQWKLPTPCEGWDVRELVNHVVMEIRWVQPLVVGLTIAEVGDRLDGDLLGADPAGAAAAAAAEAESAVAGTGTLDREVHLSFGDTPTTEYLMQLIAEHLVHGWDLAVSIGGNTALDPAVVAFCAEWFVDREQSYRRAGAIAERVALPATATPAEQLLAGFGRDPGWRGDW